MPSRYFENRPPESEPGYRFSFDDKNKEEPTEEQHQQKSKLSDKKPEQEQEKDKKESSKEDEKAKKKELSPEEKQERRSEAVERSQALKKQFEETPIPNDTTTVARLIIAEQIVNIDKQLQDPESFSGKLKKKELETALDYMCDLAEKLEDPTVESPPHIQDAYEALLELTEDTQETADTPKEVINEIAEILQLDSDEIVTPAPEATPIIDPVNPPKQQSLHTLPASNLSPAARNLRTYLHLASLRPVNASQPNFQSQTLSAIGSPRISPSPKPLSKTSEITAYPADGYTPESPPTQTAASNAHEYHIAMQPDIAKPLAAVALASITASAIHHAPEISHRHEDTRVAPPPSHHEHTRHSYKEESSHSTASLPALEGRSVHTLTTAYETKAPASLTTFNHESPSHTPSIESSVVGSKKFEHLSLSSLLTLAKDIHVGHGRYLKDEFEHGHIDKDGLIKVLKAKKKGLDFSREFTNQAAHFREKLASIEFITKPQKPSTSDDKRSETIPQITLSESVDSTSKEEEFAHPILERYAHPEKSVFQPSLKSAFPVNLIMAILAIVIFGALIIFLFLPT